MQLARFSVGTLAVVVVDAVGNIGVLLYFGDKYTFANGMDTSCGEEEYVTFFYRMKSENVGNGVVGYAAYLFVGCNLAGETRVKPGTRFCVYDIPHFGFAA